MTLRHPAVALLAVSTGIGSVSLSRANSMVESTAFGTVESLREVPLESIPARFAAFDHAIGPCDELVVRLDDGRAVTIVHNEAHLAPGERVIVLNGRRGVRLERASY